MKFLEGKSKAFRVVAYCLIAITIVAVFLTTVFYAAFFGLYLRDYDYLCNTAMASEAKRIRQEEIINNIKSGKTSFIVTGLNENDVSLATVMATFDPDAFMLDRSSMKTRAFRITTLNKTVNITYYLLPHKYTEEEVSAFEAEIDDKLKTLINDDMSDIEKLREIYSYVIDNIEYDYNVFDRNATYDIKYVYENKKGVCISYALLFTYMARKAGFEADTVCGMAGDFKIDGLNGEHAWCIVNTETGPLFFDPTWDDTNKNDNPEWFAKSNFDDTHARYDWMDVILKDKYGELSGMTISI